jgi:ribosomal protein L10
LAKRKISFKVVGVFDNEKKVVISEQEFTAIAKLPSREVLLGQVVGVMSGPIRAFMYVVSELAKKGPATPVAATPAPEAPKEAPAPASAA